MDKASNAINAIQESQSQARLTRDSMWLRSEPRIAEATKICTLPLAAEVEVVEKFQSYTKVRAQCPDEQDIVEGFILNFSGQRPFEGIRP